MTGPGPATDIALADLGVVGPTIGRGGQAVVHELPELSLPDVAGPLVYKRYKAGHAPPHGLRQIVALRTRLPEGSTARARLDRSTAWPVRQVVDPAGAVVGLVLPRIPDEFFQDLRLPSGKVDRGIREAQFLMAEPDRVQRTTGVVPTVEQRLEVCRDFAGVLDFLHGRDVDVAFGDINARNVLYRLRPMARTMLVDCDAVRVRGSMSSVAQLNAPDWEPPGEIGVLSQETDLYKLGLFILRVLGAGHESSVSRDPERARHLLSPTALGMLRDAVRQSAGARPSARDWHRRLSLELGEYLAPPRLLTADLDRSITATGQPVVLTWTAQDAQTIEVWSESGQEASAPGDPGSGRMELHPSRTSRLRVIAVNPEGTDTIVTPTVTVFEVATFHELPVPLPALDLPVPHPAELPQVAAVLPGLPGVGAQPPAPMSAFLDAWSGPDTTPVGPPVALPAPPGLAVGLHDVPFDLTTFMSGAPDPGADPRAPR